MWTSAKCDNCGWLAPNIMLAKAESGICPHCNQKALRPR